MSNPNDIPPEIRKALSGVDFPYKLQFLFESMRYKCAWGGRGSSKSWSFARALLVLGVKQPTRVLCAREFQNSISQSVHKLLSDQIIDLRLESFYEITQNTIRGQNGTEFAFVGLKNNVANIKSYEGVDICWVEEAQSVSKTSWNVLIPTIRKEQSEIWVTFNPELETDETYQRFVVSPPENCLSVKVNWQDNPWFPDTLKLEKDVQFIGMETRLIRYYENNQETIAHYLAKIQSYGYVVEVKPNVNQQCPCKLFMKRAKETLSIQANHPEYLKGLKNTIASVMKGLGNSFLLFPCR